MFISIEELKRLGLSYYKINQLVTQGDLIKINKKYYKNANYNGEESDFYYANAYVPDGVICLMSAAVYYELTTYRPDVIDVAIPRKSKASTLPKWPEFNICYFTDERHSVGINYIVEGRNSFKIYDIEKTVADIVYYREKIGIEETKEILKSYLKRKERNINNLIRYADNLKCGTILRTYLEVLL